MKRLLISLLLLIAFQTLQARENEIPLYWISSSLKGADHPNTWIAFRRDFVLKRVPAHAKAMIACDTKYWLWINGKLVVFEGGLKRGPNPRDTYADTLDFAHYLKQGENRIAILLWHFGKDGFSHKNSGKAGLLFQMNAGTVNLCSNQTWMCRIHPAYATTGKPDPNYRLAESNIRFDARNDIPGWQNVPITALKDFQNAVEIGRKGDAPWNQLVPRPVPQWKNFGVKEARFERHQGLRADTLVANLPYNMQMTPVIALKDPDGGHLIEIRTDHSRAGGTDNIRAEYITRKGVQEYESYGWMNGEKILLVVPKGVDILSVKYRETGYNTTPSGTFLCSDDFYNRFWAKGLRTLYVNMRDNYFDCPDRERAQWWGDAVLLMGESFYTYSTSAHQLMAKAMHELVDWQRPDSVLHSPIPGVYDTELPDQMLTTIGDYGFWNYYMNTGDRETIAHVYPAVKRYLALWKTDKNGLTEIRKGGWLWGDWGDNKDIRLILAGWHYLALDGAAQMAELLGYHEDGVNYRSTMKKLKVGFNQCWNGTGYRDPQYKLETDDRVQALAVITGIADSSKYGPILELFKTQFHASPYMEKYVMEALFRMGEGRYALERTRKRFGDMVNDPTHTTLFEGWGIGDKGFGGGTTNHAWSGGAQIVISRYLCGIAPLEAGYKTFLIEPSPSGFTSATLSVPTVHGMISSSFENKSGRFILKVHVPKGTTAIVRLPETSLENVKINDRNLMPSQLNVDRRWLKSKLIVIQLVSGDYTVKRNKVI